MRRLEPKHPRITPMRALKLLRTIERNRKELPAWLLDEIAEALAHHVQASFVKTRKKPRR